MKKLSIISAIIGFCAFLSAGGAFAKSAQDYENDLRRFSIILSANDPDQVREWLMDCDSGFPDIADKLLNILHNSRPRGNSTLLDAIMGKYRIIQGKPAHECISPPFDTEDVKKAYVKNWKERNSSLWQRFPSDVKRDYKRAFVSITNPMARGQR